MHAAKARRIRAPLLGIAHGVDAVLDGFEVRIVALIESHLLRVAEEVAHRDQQALGDLGHVGLHGCAALGTGDGRADDFPGAQRAARR
jgi:hypothetical protein